MSHKPKDDVCTSEIINSVSVLEAERHCTDDRECGMSI